MSRFVYEARSTALLFVDPFNVLFEGGALKRESMHAAHELNGPTYAHSIVSTREFLDALPKA
ncbi:hypothetical protein AB4Y45_04615 [Paraburkholderia sp. EG287A]|uniref:hypothetical protein n=1 Tax=unclassified Paraburkholderia TaxID=2615204 RepID=UPI0034D25739